MANDRTQPASAGEASDTWLTVRGIGPGTAAERAGFKPGEMITAINNHPVDFKSHYEMAVTMGRLESGKPAVFTVLRDRHRKEIKLVPTAMPADRYEQWKIRLAMLKSSEDRRTQPPKH